MADKFKLPIAVCVALRKGSHVLLLERKGTSWQDGMHALPGGGVDGNESILDAAVRETREEVGITLERHDLNFFHMIHVKQPEKEFCVFFFETTAWQGEPINAEPHKSSSATWFSLDQLPVNTVPHLRQALSFSKAGKFYSEFGW